MIVSRKDFFIAQSKLDNIPFNQTSEWFEKSAFQEDDALFFIDDLSNPQIGCWGILYNRRFIGKHLIISGESYKNNITSHHIRDFYLQINATDFSIIEITSLQFYEAKYEIGIRRAGFLRPMIANLSSLTICISTIEARKTHKTWNRNIRLANEAKLKFKCVENPTLNDMKIFCEIFQELKMEKKLDYNLNSNLLHKLFVNDKFKLFFIYDLNDRPISGRIIYVRDKFAYDVHAANSVNSRNTGSAYFIIDEILVYLKDKDYRIFDYGMISPCNSDMDDVYRAKSYSGGNVKLYNGQWVKYKNKFIEYFLTGYFYIVKNKIRF